ncbi:MAG: GDP-L-fucose synthase [Candidatus Marinimicrobia bacterium]|nr:GDP-L-fucose synthase [Candidatus Neomarinimicrobiota bacterium]
MNKNSKIYVAGHRGMVGSAIVRKLKEEGYNNLVFRTSKELDLRRQKDTEEFFEKERPEYVFLAAAKVGGILANSTYVAEFIYDNIMIAANVINSAYKFGVKKLLNLGSSCIYPRNCSQPMKEEYLLSGKLEPTNEPYAIAKITAIKLCKYYNEQYGTNFISVMPTNLYGPNDNFNLETAHVPAALLRKFHLAKLLKEENFDSIKKDMKKYPIGFGLDKKINLEDENSIVQNLEKIGITKDFVLIWGTGDAYREFLYVDDLANACLFLMDRYNFEDIGEFINIGTGKDVKIKEFAEMIKEIVGFDGEIRYDISKPDGTPRKLLDISRIKKFKWQPRISLKEGIKKFYDYYRNSIDRDL